MKIAASVTVSSNVPEIQALGAGMAREFAEILGEDALERAKRNVAPGQGPGPHPHRTPHEDTGDLMRSLKVKTAPKKKQWSSVVYTELLYGLFLEVGWTTVAGTHWRYPWLYSAVKEASADWETIAKSSADRFVSRAGKSKRIKSPQSATFKPLIKLDFPPGFRDSGGRFTGNL